MSSSCTVSRRQFAQMAAVGGASIALGSVISGCTKSESTTSASPDEPRDEVIIALSTTSEPAAGFDPFASWGCGEHCHEPLIQSTLVKTGADMTIENDLATDYSCSDDGLVWSFTIRTDVKFSDGEPLTAEDVAFTINGIRDAEGAEADFSMVDEAVALDDEHVEIRLLRPYNVLLYTLAVVGICPAHAHGADYGEHPIGSGRYIMTQWDKGQQVIFEANPDYYGEAPLMKRVVVVFMDDDAALAATQSGDVDVAQTSAFLADTAVEGYGLLDCKTVDCRGIALPVLPEGSTFKMDGEDVPSGNAITSDVYFRRAVNYAIDRELLIKRALNGYAHPAFSVCDGMPWACEDMIIETDVEHAKELLAEGGWKPGDDGILEKDGVRAEFKLYYMSNDTMRQSIGADVAEQLAPLGIKVIVEGMGWEELIPISFTDLQVWGWGANSPSEVYSINHTSGGANFASRSDVITDALLEDALAQKTLEESYPLFRDAQFDGKNGVTPDADAPWVWLCNVDHLFFTRDGLQVAEQKLHPHGHGWSLVNNVDRWSWAV